MRGNIYSYDDPINHYEGTIEELSVLTLWSKSALFQAYQDSEMGIKRNINYEVKKLREKPRAIDDPDYFKKWRANNKGKVREYNERTRLKKMFDQN